jgi:pimeloyl-ACP methyl ester carboxylesterase
MAVLTEIDQILEGLSDDALVTVVHLMNRFLRHSIAVKAYDDFRKAGKGPAETDPTHDIALRILREIERTSGAPINELEDTVIQYYVSSIDQLLWQRIGQRTFDTKKAEELLSSLRRGTRKRESGKKETARPFYQKGDVRIRYVEAGSGFPLLVTPGGGLNSRVSNWPTAVFNAMEAFRNDFRCITMDQRNANGGESSGPIPVDDPWGAFADDQLGLMDHLGIREFFYMGYCIGGCFAGKLLQRAPERVVAAVFCQTVGHRPDDPDVMYRSGKDVWAPELLARRSDLTMAQVEQYLHNLYRVNPDFLYSVSRDFIRNCRTPMLVLPDDTPAHPLQTSIDVASLAPNAEMTVFPWREPQELKERTIERVRTFLKAHQPVTAAASRVRLPQL